MIDKIVHQWKQTNTSLGPLTGTLKPGHITALIGPNGAGKSTLLRLIGSYLKPVSGSVRYGDVFLSQLSPFRRARLLTMVPQVMPLGFDLTVKELLSLGGYAQQRGLGRMFGSHAPEEKILQVLDRLQLEPLAHRSYRQLSGGQAQRALLGMALVQDPPILLLDEPTAHLDPGHAKNLITLLQELAHQDHKIIVVAYHDLATVGLFADQIWLMDEGQILYTGASEKVLTADIIQTTYGIRFQIIRHPATNRITLLFP